MQRRDWALALIYTPLMLFQISVAWTLYNYMNLDWVTNIGWILLCLSAVFGWLPIYTFKTRGGVPEGESYIKTTKLVDTGIYAIIRHPQYLAGILIASSMMLISQHWSSVLAGVIVIPLWYLECIYADQRLVENFGDEYRDYMRRVPRVNFVLGLIRVILNY
jgi:protein-S-isoprenylcysteine O-methyltransferase Ste14